MIHAYAVSAQGGAFEKFSYDPGPLPSDHVEVAVEHCGYCHSDLSMIDNEWGRSRYPLVPGHEVVGRIRALGSEVRGLQLGQRVGVGWLSGSCLHCRSCLGGTQQLCAKTQPTIIGRHGGFATAVRSQAAWTIPLPEGLDPASAGPLFCGGITVFSPLVECGVLPTHRVGVVGIGGLGHLALKFLNKWGCEVTAFTSSAAKAAEAQQLGAHRAVVSTDSAAIKALAGQLDFILVTVNVALDWPAYLTALAAGGRLHFVGAVTAPLNVSPQMLLSRDKAISGSPIGAPATLATMLDFCARHGIAPQVERYKLSEVNAATEHLRSGKARYRVILDNDLG